MKIHYDITMRPFEDDDMESFKNWLKKTYIAKYYHNPEDWIDELEKRKTEFSWITHLIIQINDRPVGFCQYYKYELSIPYGEDWQGTVPVQNTYSLDYLIGEEDCVGRGYGKQTVRMLIDFIKQDVAAQRIIVQPEEGNLPSCNTLRSSGFSYDEQNKLFILEF